MLKAIIVTVFMISILLVAGCNDAPTDEPEGRYQDGTYSGSALGYIDVIELEVIVEGGEITAINIIDHDETEGIADPAFDETIADIIANQSTDGVDTVSGATATSEAIIKAVDEALVDAENLD